MDAAVRAGIDLHESTLRYAEVEQYGTRFRLLRLGSCDFDFNVREELLRTDASEHLSTISEALADIFSGSVASHLHVALHPPDCYSFFVPLPVYLPRSDRAQRLKREADLLIDPPLDAPVRLHEESLFTEAIDGNHVEWFHVLGLPEHTGIHLDRVLKDAPQHAYRPRLSMQGAATTALRIASETGVTLVLGLYPDHVEYTICQDGRWRFSHHNLTTHPSDTAYFALALLHHLRLSPEAVGQVYIYDGDDSEAGHQEILEEVFGVTPQPLDALLALDIDRSSLNANFSAEAYAPCIGAAL